MEEPIKIITKKCKSCGKKFSYKFGRGLDRVHCSRVCGQKYGQKSAKLRYELLPKCKAVDCEGKATRIKSGYCEKHYYRIRRNGHLDVVNKIRKYTNCIYCNKKLKRPGTYCSQRCSARYNRGNPLYKTCIICGIKYTPDNNGIDKTTCSDACNIERIKRNDYKYKNSPVLYSTYAPQIEYAEYTEEDENGNLICKCTYCGKKYLPRPPEIRGRISALNKIMNGEQRLYCSIQCKKECPTYRMHKRYRGTKYGGSREVPAEFRQMVLEDRDYTCERCGIKKNGLHVHHIEGYTEQPMLSTDLFNILVVCKKCHRSIHKQPGCTTYDYRCIGRRV